LYDKERDIRETVWGDMGWINLAQDRDWWRALGNMAINLRVGKFLSDPRLLKKNTAP
jgi:hypothetical protein